MRSFSLAVLVALLGRTSEAFVTSPTQSGRPAFLATTSAKHQPLSVSTELTAESVGQSSEDEEGGETTVSAVVASEAEEVPIVESSFTEASALSEGASEENAAATPAAADVTPKRIERVRHTLFIGNLPFESDEDSLREILAEFGEIVMVALPRNRDSGKPRGFAFVDMATTEEMEKAIAGINGRLIDGRVVRASPSLPKEDQPKRTDSDNGMGKLYVGNISYDTTKEMLLEHFAEYGTVFEVYVPTNNNGQGRGYAFVTLKKDELEDVIANAEGSVLDGREVSVTMPLPRGEKNPRRKERAPSTKIYVGNLSFYTIQETLEEVFSEFGTVRDCYIPPDPSSGSSRGFGFVTMDPEEAQRAIAELDSCELDGRIIRVNEAQPKGSRPPVNDEEDDHDDTADE